MHEPRTVLSRLLSLTAEREWVEFKRTACEPQRLGEYLSALANAAALSREARGYLVFGVDDETHNVVGTPFDVYAEKGKGNEDLLPWLLRGLSPRVDVRHEVLEHPDGRVVVFAVSPAQGQPVAFYGKEHIRVGASLAALREHPARARALWASGVDWSGEVCGGAGLADLDPEALREAKTQFATKHPAQADAVPHWDDLTFLNKARVLKQGAVTHAALILLGRPESAAMLSPAVAKISWILKDAANREQDYLHLSPPFLLAGDRMLRQIRNLTVRTLPSGTLFPIEITQYDTWVVREALHNCIAHQDYGLYGRIAVVEFPDRLLLTNVGEFLPGDVEAVIRQDAPQSVYRNRFLVDAMVELNMIDTQGGGIKRMYETQRRRFFPLPVYDLGLREHVAVGISGRILDERYTRVLMEHAELGLEDVILLDRVQRKAPISREEHARLKAAGLVEGRFPSLMVAGTIAKVTGDTGRHIRERGFDDRYYSDLVKELIREHGPATRQAIDDLLIPKLPDRLSTVQKKSKVRNIVQNLRRSGAIRNTGSKSRPLWVLANSKQR